MEGKIRVIIIFLILLTLLSGCSNAVTDGKVISCWANMEETGFNQVRVRVRLEDGYGNAPTAARVLLESPAKEISWVYFNAANNMYEVTLTNVVSGNYKVTVQSAAGSKTMTIPMFMFSEKPGITTLQDANGIVAGQGLNLSGTSPISAEWTKLESASLYKGTIFCGTTTAYVFSTLANSFLIPADTLAAGKTYNLSIEAQYIDGDPFLQEHNYYAFSYSQSPDYFFTLE